MLGEDKINDIVYEYFKVRNDRIADLERINADLTHKLEAVLDQLEQNQTRLELVTGERDFERKKTEKLRKELDDV